MKIVNINELESLKKYLCVSEKIVSFLNGKEILPISSFIDKHKKTIWVFIDCKDLRNALKEFNKNN